MQEQSIFDCLNSPPQNDNSNMSLSQQDQVFKVKLKPKKELATCIQQRHVMAQHNFQTNQQYSQSFPFDLPKLNQTQSQVQQDLDAFNNRQIQREMHSDVRIPRRVVRNPEDRSGTYKRHQDSIWNNRDRQVRKLFLRFSPIFKIPAKIVAQWQQILKNPACKNLNLLLKKLGQFEEIYMKNTSKCEECPGFFEHLDHVIQGERMIKAMGSAFEDDEQARWDCGYVFDFCRHARYNAQQLEQGKKRSKLNKERKQEAYEFVRRITVSVK